MCNAPRMESLRMKQKRLQASFLLAAVVLLTSTGVGGPAYADGTDSDGLNLPPLTATRSEDVPDEYLIYPDGTPLPPGTETLTDEEMAAIGTTSTTSTLKLGNEAMTRASSVAGGCNFSVGNVWKRSSASSLPSGGIGAKPAINRCWGAVTKTFIRSYVYMHNGWLWVRKTKAFESYGSWNMVQKSVLYKCNGTRSNTFRVVSYFETSGARDVVPAKVQLRSADYRFSCGG